MSNPDFYLVSEDYLPSFDRPPVVETVLGVQFQPLRGFHNGHLGAFWKKLGPEWPIVTDAPTLEPVYERFGENDAWGSLRPGLKLTSDPAARLQIRNAARDAMIQLQNGRFHYNWLGAGQHEYTRYKNIRPKFDEKLDVLRAFLREEALGELLPDQWEITYVNHMPKGTVWNTPADWPRLLVGLPGTWSDPRAVRLESFGGEWHFEIEPRRGRLHVHLSHVRVPAPDHGEQLRLTLTARGPATNIESMREGLHLGRRAIVLTFKDITSPEAHAYWGLKT